SQLQNLATILVAVIVFTALIPLMLGVIADSPATGIERALMEYLPFFAVLGLTLAIVAWAIPPAFKKGGGS
ncbi:unnamed protein product, partial [marine sediment metagenome]